jgi:hypothetical protein
LATVANTVAFKWPNPFQRLRPPIDLAWSGWKAKKGKKGKKDKNRFAFFALLAFFASRGFGEATFIIL